MEEEAARDGQSEERPGPGPGQRRPKVVTLLLLSSPRSKAEVAGGRLSGDVIRKRNTCLLYRMLVISVSSTGMYGSRRLNMCNRFNKRSNELLILAATVSADDVLRVLSWLF